MLTQNREYRPNALLDLKINDGGGFYVGQNETIEEVQTIIDVLKKPWVKTFLWSWLVPLFVFSSCELIIEPDKFTVESFLTYQLFFAAATVAGEFIARYRHRKKLT